MSDFKSDIFIAGFKEIEQTQDNKECLTNLTWWSSNMKPGSTFLCVSGEGASIGNSNVTMRSSFEISGL